MLLEAAIASSSILCRFINNGTYCGRVSFQTWSISLAQRAMDSSNSNPTTATTSTLMQQLARVNIKNLFHAANQAKHPSAALWCVMLCSMLLLRRICMGRIRCLQFCHFPHADCSLPAAFSSHCRGNIIKSTMPMFHVTRGPYRRLTGPSVDNK